jgi:hypothetical protein
VSPALFLLRNRYPNTAQLAVVKEEAKDEYE